MKKGQTILSLLICLLTFNLLAISQASSTSWKTVYADVDWDNVNEPIGFMTEETYSTYPWRAPLLLAGMVERIAMAVENLRETVYYMGNRVLDEGYWDGPLYGPREHFDALYNTKATHIDAAGNIVTVWESDCAVLKRIVDLRYDGCTLRYQVWLKNFGYEAVGEPLAETGMGILWNYEPRVGTPEDSLAYILSRMETFYDQSAQYYKGITIPGLSFVVDYTFDDTMKEISDHSLIGWDGAGIVDFLLAGIGYDDPRFSPLTTDLYYQEYGARALWGIVHLPKPDQLSLVNGQFIDTEFQGVGPTGKCGQLTSVEYLPPITSTINIDPDTLNLKSNGEWITAYIELPEGYNVADIIIPTIYVNHTVPVDSDAQWQVGDYDNDAIPDLMVKFDRAIIMQWLQVIDLDAGSEKYSTVVLMMTCQLANPPTRFVGSDTVRLLKK